MKNSATHEAQIGILYKLDNLTVGVNDSDGTQVSPATHEDIADLITAVQNSGGTKQVTFISTITRPANTTVYTAGDVIGDVSGALMPFKDILGSTDITKANGTGLKVTEVIIRTTDTGMAGKKARIHFYKDAVAAIADNAPFVFDDANITKRKRYIDVVFGIGSTAKVAVNDWSEFIINPVARTVYPVLEDVDGHTPSANGTIFYMEISGELSNN